MPEPDPTDVRSTCQFLAVETAAGTFEPAPGGVHPANRCIAIGEPVPQSGQQQELVCLTASHLNCPRYLRGILVEDEATPTPRREAISPAVIAATLVLLASLAASFGFLAVRGGFTMPVASLSPSQVALAPSLSAEPSVAVTASPAPSVGPSPSVEPSATPSPTEAPTPTPTAKPTPRPTPVPTSDRFQLLTKCPSTPDCWIYTIRAGDNLRSIANYFGVSYNRMMAMNPNLRIPIHPGDKLRMPTPTR